MSAPLEYSGRCTDLLHEQVNKDVEGANLAGEAEKPRLKTWEEVKKDLKTNRELVLRLYLLMALLVYWVLCFFSTTILMWSPCFILIYSGLKMIIMREHIT